VQKFSTSNVRLPDVHRLTVLEDRLEELQSSQISFAEAKGEMKGGAKAYLYFVREFEGDPKEESRFVRGRRVDLCSRANPVKSLAKNEGNSDVNSGSILKFGGDSNEDLNSARGHQVDLCSVVDPNVDPTKKGENSIKDSSAAQSHSVGFSLNEIEKTRLSQLNHGYRDIFCEDLLEELPLKCAIDHTIDMGDHSSINKNVYPLSVERL